MPWRATCSTIDWYSCWRRSIWIAMPWSRLNLTAQQAVQIVGDARDWMERAEATLAAADARIAEQAIAVRRLEKAIRMGPADGQRDAALAAARDALAAARTARRAALSTLVTTISAQLSETQQATWTAIQQGYGQQMPIRMLALTSEQRHGL